MTHTRLPMSLIPYCRRCTPITSWVFFANTPTEIPHGRFRIEPIGPLDRTLRPLLLSATGRSGTTLLMRRRAMRQKSPAIIRFGMGLLTYYAHALKVLTKASSVQDPASIDQVTEDLYPPGLNPFHHTDMEQMFPDHASLYWSFRRWAGARLRGAFHDIVDYFCREMQIHTRKPQAIFFAEKSDVFITARYSGQLAFDKTRELLLVRDLRDVYCSRLPER